MLPASTCQPFVSDSCVFGCAGLQLSALSLSDVGVCTVDGMSWKAYLPLLFPGGDCVELVFFSFSGL